MTRIHHLQLVLPNALAQLRGIQPTQTQAPVLHDWLRKAQRQRLWLADDWQYARLDPWQHSLLHALPAELREHGLASASLQWRGEGGEWPAATCLHAEPIHLSAGIDDLSLLLPAAPTQDEEARLLASLQPLMAVAGFDLQASPSGTRGHWYMLCDRQLSLTTYSPRAGIATRIYEAQPQGEDGGALRRVMTEAQMLLHEHPVNQRRERRGVPTLNALWFWGSASLTLVTQQATPRVMSNHSYVQGLCEHLHLNCWPLPHDGSTLLSVAAEQVLLVLPEAELGAWSTWLDPVQHALQHGEIEQLDVYVDHWQLSLRGGRWAQFKRLLSSAADLTDVLS
jgi:hypothetical protein